MYTSKNKKRVAIVIPTHRLELRDDEKISLDYVEKILGKYDKIIAIPEHLNTKSFTRKGYKFVKFPSYYFASWKGYCELLLKKEFYEKFIDYDYILIYQLDVVVFSDQLQDWCEKGYDYIGAPLVNTRIGQISYKFTPYICGNGGFCLRNVKSFLKVIEVTNKESRRESSSSRMRILWFILAMLTLQVRGRWMKAPAECYPFAEDGFWSFEAKKYYPKFNIAPIDESFKFAFERFPRLCFKINNNHLPFGVHAWQKHDIEFWKPFISEKPHKSK